MICGKPMTKQTKIIIFSICILKLALHLIADYHSGIRGDELLYIQMGNHLAFGNMEVPPMIGLLAFIQNLFHSQSVFAYHIFPHIAMLLIIIYVVKITVDLGGKSIAEFVTLF